MFSQDGQKKTQVDLLTYVSQVSSLHLFIKYLLRPYDVLGGGVSVSKKITAPAFMKRIVLMFNNSNS